MSIELLDKTRKINCLVFNNSSNEVIFNDVCEVLSQVIKSNVLVVTNKGKILGAKNSEQAKELEKLIPGTVGNRIDKSLNKRILNILSTKENINLKTLGFKSEGIEKYKGLVVPVIMGNQRLASLFAYKTTGDYGIQDIILSEYGAAIVGLDLMRSINEEKAELKRREKMVKSAINTLSSSELEAIKHVFNELEGTEGILVASKIADRVGITRSVIVNALRKFESAGIIVSRSSGMKGTYIKIVNKKIINHLKSIEDS